MLRLFEKANHFPFMPFFAPGAAPSITLNPEFLTDPAQSWNGQGAFTIANGRAEAIASQQYGMVQAVSMVQGALYRVYLRVLACNGKALLTSSTGELEQRITKYGYYEFDFVATANACTITVQLYTGQFISLDSLYIRPI